MRIEGRMVRVFVLFPRRDALGFQHPHKDCPPTPDPSSAFCAVAGVYFYMRVFIPRRDYL